MARPGRLAEWLGVAAPTVTVSLQRLARDGWVSVAPDRSVELTAPGGQAAAAIVRRHRILERWLTDVLGLDWAAADREAQSLAHGMSDLVLDRLDGLLGHPATCPHGNVIPGRRPPAGRPLVRLVDLEPGQRAPVARISEVAEHEAPQLLAVLGELAIRPGAVVEAGAPHDGGHGVLIDEREAVLDDAVARAVWVQQP
ncbi:MAG: metal-dependent transcriptional regulator [Candidatus Dormibacteraeota bacterium]|nr:metal-dependent transcriptional regulator [Candidatus Dormibacteraeota bacterium]